jgi:hypothetical protein
MGDVFGTSLEKYVLDVLGDVLVDVLGDLLGMVFGAGRYTWRTR